MQGAWRAASILRRMAMRATSRIEEALWAISSKQAPRDLKPRGGVAIDRHGRCIENYASSFRDVKRHVADRG